MSQLLFRMGVGWVFELSFDVEAVPELRILAHFFVHVEHQHLIGFEMDAEPKGKRV